MFKSKNKFCPTTFYMSMQSVDPETCIGDTNSVLMLSYYLCGVFNLKAKFAA